MLCILYIAWDETHRKIEHFSFLLVGSPLGNVYFTHIGLWSSWFDRLGGATMLEGIWNIKIFHRQHVLQGLHSGIQSFSDLQKRGAQQLWNKLGEWHILVIIIGHQAAFLYCACSNVQGSQWEHSGKPLDTSALHKFPTQIFQLTGNSSTVGWRSCGTDCKANSTVHWKKDQSQLLLSPLHSLSWEWRV